MPNNKLPVLKSEMVLKIFLDLGFVPIRRKGSHLILKRKNVRIVIPIHKARDLPKGTILSIIKQSGISKYDFLKKLKNC